MGHGTKAGKRLLVGCEKIRKLLSQIKETKVTVENLTDGGDATFDLTRDEMSRSCDSILERFRSLLLSALSKAQLTPGDIHAIEIVGGGLRMQVVQAVVVSIFGESLPLGAKLDDNSVTYGAALAVVSKMAEEKAAELMLEEVLRQRMTDTETKGDEKKEDEEVGELKTPVQNEDKMMDSKNFSEVAQTLAASVNQTKGFRSREEDGDDCFGFSPMVMEEARAFEVRMQSKNEEIKKVQDTRNDFEAFIFDMRSAPRRKHGELITGNLNGLMDECENWLWDNERASFQEVEKKLKKARGDASDLCKEFDAADDEDHDTRKLKKPERMRLVLKNKEEGTELFKGGNYRPAAARYHKSLTHCAKFFDLTPDDENEVKATKLSLYLNLAQCYIKLENFENVIRNCNEALQIDPANAKAFFRRAAAYETTKDWDKALADLKAAAKANPEDKGI